MTPDVPEFPPDAQRIVERWDPEGLRRWRDRDRPGCAVQVVAVRGIDPTSVLDALAPFEPVTCAPDGAAVVVMVLDGASVLGRDELAALDAAAADVERVVFVLTGGDAHPDRDAVRERDAALLRAHAARFADVRVLPGPDVLPAVVRDALVADPGVIADRNTRRGAHSLVERTCRWITETARATRDGSDATGAELRARKARLVAMRDGGRAERLARLRGDVQRARIDLMHAAGTEVRAVSAAVRADIDRSGRRELATLPERMGELAGRAATDLDEVVGRRLTELAARAGVSDLPAAAPAPPDPPPGPEPRHRGVEDRMMVVVGASAGVGLGRLAVAPISMVPALDIATIPVTLALGGAAAWWLAGARRLVAERVHLRQWVSDAAAHLRSQLEQRVLGRILETEAAVSARVIADSRAAGLAVDEELAAVDGEARRLAAQRSGRVASCERDRAALAEVLEALENSKNSWEPGGVEPRPTP
ncbi:hypothetical protein [Prescottella agglutinans]|uniref:hypothetical protein n=1 Tax=Prescottella agglutinans TaxID=1644129 RepID=UPI003D98709A